MYDNDFSGSKRRTVLSAPDVKKFQWSKVPFWIREEQLFGTECTSETEVKGDKNDPDDFFSEFE